MNDKKHSTKTRKKRTVFIVVIISVLIVVVGGASVWSYYADKKAQEIAVEQREKAKESFNALNLAGDIEKGADYVSLIESNKGNEALAVYTRAVDSVTAKEEKLAIIDDLIAVANQKQQFDHMLFATKRRVELDPSVESYYFLSLACDANQDYTGRVEALGHLMAVFDTQYPAPRDNEHQELYVTYESELANAREVLKLYQTSQGGE